jgi:hypothetical protein
MESVETVWHGGEAHNTRGEDGSLREMTAKSRSKSCYRRARIVRANVEDSAAIRSSLATAFRVSVCVPDFRWSAISWRSRWISLMLSFMCASFRVVPVPGQPWRGWISPRQLLLLCKPGAGYAIRFRTSRSKARAIEKHLGLEQEDCGVSPAKFKGVVTEQVQQQQHLPQPALREWAEPREKRPVVMRCK